jgi:hypothetical protein
LFNAVANDRGEGIVDLDFVQQVSTIYKRLARNAKLWPSLWKADKNRAA